MGTLTNKAVITGAGVLSPVGVGSAQYWEGLFHGRTGFRPISLFDSSSFPVHIAGEVEFDPVQFLGKKGLRTLDRSTRLIGSAAQLAIDETGIRIDEQNTYRTGVCVGTTFGSLHSISQFDREGLTEGPRLVNPSHFPNTVINSPASQISIRFRIKGFNTTVSTGFCAGLDAVTYAADFIRLRRADVVFAGGVEELCEETFSGFYRLGCLSGTNGAEPACRPFDARRNGIILSEGAAILVIEDEEHALKRGAHILATVRGYGNAFDLRPHRHWEGEGQGLSNAIRLALKDASLSPEDIGCVAASANSTRGLDMMETRVIKDVFGGYARQLPVTSIKSMIGESFSASGALSLSAAVGMIQHGTIPPTVNYEEKDPDCDLDYVPGISRHSKVNTVLVISSDPYGQNTAVVLEKY